MTIRTNVIYCGDCRDVLKTIPDTCIDLISLDPPFFSQKNYETFWMLDKSTKTGFTDKDWHKLRDEVDPAILAEYDHLEQRWKGGRQGIYVYIAYMRERLQQCERVLKDTGTIYFHCDTHASHYLKIMMDEIFGYDNMLNEIIWSYKGGGASKRAFGRRHDTIFAYIKSDRYTFNADAVRVPYLSAEGRDSQWAWGHHEGTDKSYKPNELGKIPEDVWEIPTINSQSKERLGYPTQKPEALLDRIIKVSSNVDDIVLDPFAGCGSALAVAQKLNRQFIGIDISRTGCDVTKERLGGGVQVIGGESIEDLGKMDPHDFARLMIQEKLGGAVNPKKSGDMGIDGWVAFKTIPVQVKRWGHAVGRPDVDKFRTAVSRIQHKKGIMIGFEFSKDAYAEAKRVGPDEVQLELVTVQQILDGWEVHT